MDQKDRSLYMSSTTILALHQSLTVIPNQYDSSDYYSTNQSTSYDYQGNYNQAGCHCVIDLSTPATLERDFYAWLNVNFNKIFKPKIFRV